MHPQVLHVYARQTQMTTLATVCEMTAYVCTYMQVPEDVDGVEFIKIKRV